MILERKKQMTFSFPSPKKRNLDKPSQRQIIRKVFAGKLRETNLTEADKRNFWWPFSHFHIHPVVINFSVVSADKIVPREKWFLTAVSLTMDKWRWWLAFTQFQQFQCGSKHMLRWWWAKPFHTRFMIYCCEGKGERERKRNSALHNWYWFAIAA